MTVSERGTAVAEALLMLDPQTTVSQTVLDHPSCAQVFQRHRIDFCCQGGKTIAQACNDRHLDPARVLGELQRAIEERRAPTSPDAATMSTPELVGHIVATHHAYLRKTLPFVVALANKVARVHGDRDPRLGDLLDALEELTATIIPHLDFEERVLFPAMMAGRVEGGAIARDLELMHDEHLGVGALLHRLADLTDGFVVPAWACFSYRTLLAEAQQLHGDTLTHVHLENHALAPRFNS